ncbi:MAG: hypothetical protein HW415_1220 [Deltaproteobacteria bacterium]|nr:hypothetical protein [Deltaproteobacteria bacterium]
MKRASLAEALSSPAISSYSGKIGIVSPEFNFRIIMIRVKLWKLWGQVYLFNFL